MMLPGEPARIPRLLQAQANANLALTTPTDIPGATLTVVTTQPDAVVLIAVSADFQATGATAATGCVVANIDGADVGPQALFNHQSAGSGARVTAATMCVATIASTGSHVIKLRGFQASGATMIRTNATHTQLSVLLFE